mgnify:CR=1 FL=1
MLALYLKVLSMKESEIYDELSSIRNLMERSVKFMSISGLAGVLAGCYALLGAAAAYGIVYGFGADSGYRGHFFAAREIVVQLSAIAVTVLLLSVATGILMSVRKAKRLQQSIWNPASRSLLIMVAVPLIAGGLLVLIFLWRGLYTIISPAFLIFYGLALVAGSPYTFHEVRWLGITEIALGLLAALVPGSGLVLWAIGFGVLHIVYGGIMYYRYER